MSEFRSTEEELQRYDLHVHTDASPCSRASPSEVAAAAVTAGMAGIAVTDHDTTVGAHRVREHAPRRWT